MKIAVLASGELGYHILNELSDEVRPQFIATDHRSEKIIDFAKKWEIPLFEGNPRKGNLKGFINNLGLEADVLLSVNYIFLIEKDVIEFATYTINFHGSLLPRYRGRTPHVWAIINNEKETGVTAHLIDQSCDTGAVLLQKKVKIEEEDTGASVLEKFRDIYPDMVKEVIRKIQKNELHPIEQDHRFATFFGKRTPEDGKIDWNWQKERIRNWIRAQSYPYPGAFSFIDQQKVIIDKVSYSDFGFHQQDINGTILSDSGKGIIVKTPNGTVSLDRIRNEALLSLLKKGKILK